MQAIVDLKHALGIRTSLPQDVKDNLERVESMYAHMCISMDHPMPSARTKDNLENFRHLLGGFFTYDIYVWESIQDVEHDYSGMTIVQTCRTYNVCHAH